MFIYSYEHAWYVLATGYLTSYPVSGHLRQIIQAIVPHMAWWQITKIISIILAEMGVWYFSLHMQNIGSQISSATLLAWYTLTNQCRDWFIWPMNIRWAKTKTNRRYLGISVEAKYGELFPNYHCACFKREYWNTSGIEFCFLFLEHFFQLSLIQSESSLTPFPCQKLGYEWVEIFALYYPSI